MSPAPKTSESAEMSNIDQADVVWLRAVRRMGGDVDLVMLVMNDRGLQHLLSSKFELTGEGSVAAGSVGRHASAGTDWKMNTELLTYSRSKGVFAGLTLEGAVVEQDNDSTRAIYGKHMTFRNILSSKASTPASAESFVNAVSNAGHQARTRSQRRQVIT